MDYRIIVALTLMAATAAGVAQAPGRGPLQMEIAGVRLGMPLTQARAAVAGSYRCDAQAGALTFEQKVGDEVKKRRTGNDGRWGGGEGTSFLQCAGRNGEELKLTVAETASGAVVDEIRLHLQKSRFDATEVYAQVRARYGAPSFVSGKTFASWCNAGEKCTGNLLLAQGPMLIADNGAYGVTVEADRGDRAQAADAAAVQAAADRLAPKKSKAAL